MSFSIFFKGGAGGMSISHLFLWGLSKIPSNVTGSLRGVGGGGRGEAIKKVSIKTTIFFGEFPLSFVRISMCHWGVKEREKGA